MFRCYHILNKDGDVEMSISFEGHGWFTIHYPLYEQQREILRSNSCFMNVSGEQLGMILFAYSKDEYLKFCEFYKIQICKKDED